MPAFALHGCACDAPVLWQGPVPTTPMVASGLARCLLCLGSAIYTAVPWQAQLLAPSLSTRVRRQPGLIGIALSTAAG